MRKRKVVVIIIGILILIALVGTFLLERSMREVNSRGITYVQTLNNEYNSLHGVTVDVTGGEEWKSRDQQYIGAQYDGVIYNHTNRDIKNWMVSIKIPEGSYIDSSWNGTFTIEGDTLSVIPVSYNERIPAGDSQTFGLVLYTPVQFVADHIMINVQRITSVREYLLYWIILALIGGAIVILLAHTVISVKFYRMKQKQEQYKDIIVQSLKTFANAIDAKDEYTKGHSERVAAYSKEIARRLDMSEEEQDMIYYIAMMHDIGKIGVSDYILNKPGRLNDDEFRVIKMHPTIGGDILKDFSSIPGISDGARYHHERYDGKGYTKGLAGEEIPLCARIICVADAYDAMTSARCYRRDLTEEYVLSELRNCSGTQFDPRMAACMIAMVEDGTAPIHIGGKTEIT